MHHLELKEALEAHYGAVLAEPPTLCQDALLVSLNNGVLLELRYPAASEYAIAWRWEDAQLRIDTAPLHRTLATFPNHLHDASDVLREDRLTHPSAEPWANVRAVIDAVLVDPLLQA